METSIPPDCRPSRSDQNKTFPLLFLPSSPQDAVNLITHSKTRSNPENNVALMTLSDLAVLVTLTTDTGKILAKLHQVNPVSELKFIPGIKIAHLCLKHRQGKNHKTRIVAFVG